MNIDHSYESDEEVKYGGKKKKPSKKGYSIPNNQLGFQTKLAYDVIDPRNMPRICRRKKYKSYALNTKQNFLSRLRMAIDVNDLPQNTLSTQFRVSKLSEWNWVKKVEYRSRQKDFCSICLQQNIIAPQITFCGHIFCFHCILMHFTKSKNSSICPVCKQFTQQSQLKTCETHSQNQLNVEDEIIFKLKFRMGRTIYDCQTLTEDLKIEQIIRMKTKGILQILQAQLHQISNELNKTSQNHRNHHYLLKAQQISKLKILKTEKILEDKKNYYKLRENQILENERIIKMATNEQKNKFQPFFQEQTGKFIFLHKLSTKYLNKKVVEKINRVKAKIIFKEETCYGEISEYKHLSHLNPSIEIDLVIVDLQGLISQQDNLNYQKEFKQFLKARAEIQRKQEIQAENLRKKYQEQQKYIKKLKELEQTQFQIKVPTELDPNDLNQFSFPSLISEDQKNRQQQIPQQQSSPQLKRNQTQIVKIQENQFPQLEKLNTVKSTAPYKSQKGKNKKKVMKVDMTHLLFSERQENNE